MGRKGKGHREGRRSESRVGAKEAKRDDGMERKKRSELRWEAGVKCSVAISNSTLLLMTIIIIIISPTD